MLPGQSAAESPNNRDGRHRGSALRPPSPANPVPSQRVLRHLLPYNKLGGFNHHQECRQSTWMPGLRLVPRRTQWPGLGSCRPVRRLHSTPPAPHHLPGAGACAGRPTPRRETEPLREVERVQWLGPCPVNLGWVLQALVTQTFHQLSCS